MSLNAVVAEVRANAEAGLWPDPDGFNRLFERLWHRYREAPARYWHASQGGETLERACAAMLYASAQAQGRQYVFHNWTSTTLHFQGIEWLPEMPPCLASQEHDTPNASVLDVPGVSCIEANPWPTPEDLAAVIEPDYRLQAQAGEGRHIAIVAPHVLHRIPSGHRVLAHLASHRAWQEACRGDAVTVLDVRWSGLRFDLVSEAVATPSTMPAPSAAHALLRAARDADAASAGSTGGRLYSIHLAGTREIHLAGTREPELVVSHSWVPRVIRDLVAP